MDTSETIKEFWLEGKDLHTLSEDGKEMVYTDAVVTDIKHEFEGPGVTVEPVTFVAQYEPIGPDEEDEDDEDFEELEDEDFEDEDEEEDDE